MKTRAPRNRTLTCSNDEIERLSRDVLTISDQATPQQLEQRVVCSDIFELAEYLPGSFVDLLVLDPPYNLSRNFNGHIFKERKKEDYQRWFQDVLNILKPTLCQDLEPWQGSVTVECGNNEGFDFRGKSDIIPESEQSEYPHISDYCKSISP